MKRRLGIYFWVPVLFACLAFWTAVILLVCDAYNWSVFGV